MHVRTIRSRIEERDGRAEDPLEELLVEADQRHVDVVARQYRTNVHGERRRDAGGDVARREDLVGHPRE